MAVSGSAQLRPGYPRAEFSLTSRKYTCQWIVHVTSYNDGPIVAQSASGLPAAYDTYAIGSETDTYARLRSWSAYRLEENSLDWVVEGIWSTPTEKGGEDRGTGGGTHTDTAGDYSNPLAELPVLKTQIIEKEVPITRIRNIHTGNYNPLMNSACEVFVPSPTKKQVGLGISISRNEAVSTLHPALGVQYATAVNADTFWGFLPGLVQCRTITVEQQSKQIQGGTTFVYLRCDYQFEVIPEGWDVFVLDAGSYYCNCNSQSCCSSGSGFSSGCCSGCSGCSGSGSGFSGSGASGQEPPINCPWCTTKVPFQDQKGSPIKGLLDGFGGRLPKGCDPFYMTCRPYNWLPFSVLSLPQTWAGVQ